MADGPGDPPPRRDTEVGLREKRIEINEEFASIEQFVSEYVTNISHSGAFIRARDPWPVGSLLQLRFTIVADDLEILEGEAKVIRVESEPSGMGVEFVTLTDASRALIDELLARARRG